MKFKVGDRVKFNSKSSNHAGGAIFNHLDGDLAKIITIDDRAQNLPYEVKFDHGTEMWMFEDHLELVPVEENAQDPAQLLEAVSVGVGADFETKFDTPSPSADYSLEMPTFNEALLKENDKLKKQIKLLKILLESQGCDKEIIASALELLD